MAKILEKHLGHSKQCLQNWLQKPNFEKLRDPSHFLGPIYVHPKRPFPATKRAFEVNKGRTDLSTSRYESIVKFDKVFVTGGEVFVTSHKDLCTGALWSSDTSQKRRTTLSNSLVFAAGFVRPVWSGLTYFLLNLPDSREATSET